MRSLRKQDELNTKEQQTIDNAREKVMNGEDEMNINTIWQPNVRPTEDRLPYPGGGGGGGSSQQQEGRRLYTKTSLHLTTPSGDTQDDKDEAADYIERRRRLALNREILLASESFNSSPKPFTRQTTLPDNSQHNYKTITASQAATTRLPYGTKSQSFSHHQDTSQQHQQQHSRTRAFSPSVEYSTIKRQDNIDDEDKDDARLLADNSMAPKLVHNQYNSPIDLYSMNNIRKTIEAHSEIIAPGVKAINFNKLDTPVNKQSEVYKLVMEEEQKHQQAAPAAAAAPKQTRLSPISGQPVGLPSGYAASASSPSSASASMATSWSPANTQQPTQASERLKCCECGQFIVGPFARLQNRHIHPHCFNCTTCGTSLKNSGYFTINDKLYCDIHAKQVANLMRLNYNFDANSQTTSTSSSSSRPTNLDYHQTDQQRPRPPPLDDGRRTPQPLVGQQQQQQQQHVSANHFGQRSATISTMFSSASTAAGQTSSTGGRRFDDCSDSHQRQQQHVRWSWRPAGDQTSGDSTASAPSTATMTKINNNMASISSYERQLSSSAANQQMGHSARLVRHETWAPQSSAGSRTPVCVNCGQHVHGPYILAGERVWCKACSATQFTCSVCHRSLLNIGFIEDAPGRYHCEPCFDAYSAPTCSKCHLKVRGDCLNALDRQWHPTCFVCTHCREPFGNSSFYLEDNRPYCQRDWNLLFTTKCFSCSYPIEAGDKWIEAMDRNYHSNCFRCSQCQAKLEGSTFYCKAGKPYCRLHATR